jgi:hypothetical protein
LHLPRIVCNLHKLLGCAHTLLKVAGCPPAGVTRRLNCQLRVECTACIDLAALQTHGCEVNILLPSCQQCLRMCNAAAFATQPSQCCITTWHVLTNLRKATYVLSPQHQHCETPVKRGWQPTTQTHSTHHHWQAHQVQLPPQYTLNNHRATIGPPLKRRLRCANKDPPPQCSDVTQSTPLHTQSVAKPVSEAPPCPAASTSAAAGVSG